MSIQILDPHSIESIFRERVRERRYIYSPASVEPSKHDYKDYVTDTLISEPAVKFDIGEHPRDYYLVSNNRLYKVIPLEVEVENKTVKFIDTYVKADKIERFTKRSAEYQGLLFLIDFMRPYDDEYFKQFVEPSEAYIGLVDSEEEGLSKAPGKRGNKVAKIKVDPGQKVSIYISIPTPFTGVVQNTVEMYIPSGVVVRPYIVTYVAGFETKEQEMADAEGIDQWAVITVCYAQATAKPYDFVIEIENTSSDTKYVYISRIAVIYVQNVGVTAFELKLRERVVTKVENVTDYTIMATHWMHYRPGSIVVMIQSSIEIAGDGSNPITADLYVGDTKVYSVSRTETSFGNYMVTFVVRYKRGGGFDVSWKVSTTGVGYVRSAAIILFAMYDEPPRYVKRVSGSYTSDGDGIADVVTILDYTTALKHISKLLRIKASGDSNTTELKLKVDGQEFWDFLNDGDTCTLVLEHCKKIELVVNDPGGGTTTTVNYIVQFEEEDAHLVK